MADTELKPCPFCGSTDVGGGSGIVHCYRCKVATTACATTAEAVELWNRRSTSSVGEIILPAGLCRDDTEHDVEYFTSEQMRGFGHACYRMGHDAATKAAAPADAPKWSQSDLYAILHAALTQQVEGAKQAGKLVEWFSAARGLVEYLAMQEGIRAPAEDAHDCGNLGCRGCIDPANLKRELGIAEDAREEVPTPPTLPKYLLSLIGNYGMARTETVGTLEIQYRWEKLIEGIKRYATDYANLARRASSVPAIQGTDEGAEFLAEVFNRLTQEQKLSVPQEVAGRLGAFMVRNGYRIVFGRWYLQAAPSHPSEAKTCTCPSGDGSLRWPCPVHPLEAKAGEPPCS